MADEIKKLQHKLDRNPHPTGDDLKGKTYEELKASHDLQDKLRELQDKLAEKRQAITVKLLFDDLLNEYDMKLSGNRSVASMFKRKLDVE